LCEGEKNDVAVDFQELQKKKMKSTLKKGTSKQGGKGTTFQMPNWKRRITGGSGGHSRE